MRLSLSAMVWASWIWWAVHSEVLRASASATSASIRVGGVQEHPNSPPVKRLARVDQVIERPDGLLHGDGRIRSVGEDDVDYGVTRGRIVSVQVR